MGTFTTKLEVELDSSKSNDGRGAWSLIVPLVYESELTQKTYTIPTGFITDFASVPRIPFLFDMFGDSAHEAATLHDWLYGTGTEPRAIADRLFLEAMTSTGIPTFRQHAMYCAVRAFGWMFYKKKK